MEWARASDTLVFFPTYNEAGTIDPLLDRLLNLAEHVDVLVVDDSSTDGTSAILARRAAADTRLHVISRPGKLGIGSAHKLGWATAREAGYRNFVTLDADLSHNPADVPRLMAALEAGADIAIGSRFMPGGQLDYVGWRRFVSIGGNTLARTLLGLNISEFTTSLRAAKLARVPVGLVETIDSDGYSFFLTCMVRFARAGLRIAEIPIHFVDREHGQSKIPKLELLRCMANLADLAIGPQRFRKF
jgi:glycosyltransferase involved in cell wall biosynthesis